MTEAHSTGEEHAHFNLWVIGACLLVLTGASFLTYFVKAEFDLNQLQIALFVLMISFCKASLVVGFFMHFRYEKIWKYFLCIPPCVLSVVLTLALLPDVAYVIYIKVPWNQ